MTAAETPTFPTLNRLSESDLTRLLTEEPPQPREILDRIFVVGGKLPAAQLPPLVLRTYVLTDMAIDADVHDIGRAFESWPSESGAYANDAIGWCEEIGATEFAQMLRDAIALLPNGVLPRDYAARSRAVSGVRDLAGRKNPFAAISKKYQKAIKGIDAVLAAFLAGRRSELMGELGVVERAIVERDTKGLVRIKDDLKFLEAVDDAVGRVVLPGEGGNALRLARRVSHWLVNAYLYVGNDGMWKFLDGGNVHTEWDEARQWCRAIGAERAAEYLAAVAAAFPGGRMPDDYDEMMAIVDGFQDTMPEDANDPWYNVDALSRVDKEHEGALDEMVVALRAFVKAEGADWIAALGRVERGDFVPREKKAVSKKSKAVPAVRTVKTADEKAQAKFANAKPPERLDHPALDALSDAAYALSISDWMRVVRTRLAMGDAITDAYKRIAAASPDGQLPGVQSGARGEARTRQELHGRAYTVAYHIAHRLPEKYADAEGDLPLRQRASLLLHAGQLAIMTYQAGKKDVRDDVVTFLGLFGPAVTKSLDQLERSSAAGSTKKGSVKKASKKAAKKSAKKPAKKSAKKTPRRRPR